MRAPTQIEATRSFLFWLDERKADLNRLPVYDAPNLHLISSLVGVGTIFSFFAVGRGTTAREFWKGGGCIGDRF